MTEQELRETMDTETIRKAFLKAYPLSAKEFDAWLEDERRAQRRSAYLNGWRDAMHRIRMVGLENPSEDRAEKAHRMDAYMEASQAVQDAEDRLPYAETGAKFPDAEERARVRAFLQEKRGLHRRDAEESRSASYKPQRAPEETVEEFAARSVGVESEEAPSIIIDINYKPVGNPERQYWKRNGVGKYEKTDNPEEADGYTLATRSVLHYTPGPVEERYGLSSIYGQSEPVVPAMTEDAATVGIPRPRPTHSHTWGAPIGKPAARPCTEAGCTAVQPVAWDMGGDEDNPKPSGPPVPPDSPFSEETGQILPGLVDLLSRVPVWENLTDREKTVVKGLPPYLLKAWLKDIGVSPADIVAIVAKRLLK